MMSHTIKKITGIAHGLDHRELFLQPELIYLDRDGTRPFPQASRQPLRRQFFQVCFTRVAFGNFVLRQIGLVEGQLQIALFGHTTGIRDGVRKFHEGRFHFLARLYVQLIGIEFHPVRIIQRLAGLQAQHHVMRARIVLLQVVTIVRSHEREAEFLMNFHQAGIRNALMLQAVGLHFQVIAVLPEYLDKLAGGAHRAIHIFLPDQPRYFTTQAAGQGDQAFVVLLEQFLIHPRFVIEPFEVRFTDQLDEILVAGEIGGEQDQVIVVVMRKGAFTSLSAARCHVGFAPDNRLDSAGQRFLVELHRPEQVAMVRHGDRRHAEVFHLLDERFNLIRPIEQAVLRV